MHKVGHGCALEMGGGCLRTGSERKKRRGADVLQILGGGRQGKVGRCVIGDPNSIHLALFNQSTAMTTKDVWTVFDFV
jgi:hypothetical protein